MKQREKGMVEYKKGPISDKNMRQHLELPANDPDFKSSNVYVDDECDKAIAELYGKISPFWSPILTQAVLYYFYGRFKVTLCTHYKAIMCFMNKVGSFNYEIVKNIQFLWDFYAFYIFYILMHIKNPRAFILCAKCNST